MKNFRRIQNYLKIYSKIRNGNQFQDILTIDNIMNSDSFASKITNQHECVKGFKRKLA